jgi:hypothetical protein
VATVLPQRFMGVTVVSYVSLIKSVMAFGTGRVEIMA